jgi:hypothetical protein
MPWVRCSGQEDGPTVERMVSLHGVEKVKKVLALFEEK